MILLSKYGPFKMVNYCTFLSFESIRITSRTLRGHEGNITDIVTYPDSSLLLTSSEDYILRIWNTHGHIPVAQCVGHTAYINAIKVSSLSFGCYFVDMQRIWNLHYGI